MREVPRRRRRRLVGVPRTRAAAGRLAARRSAFGEQLDLVLLGGEPLHVAVREHVVEEHELPRDQRGAPLPPIAVVLLPEHAVERARVQVIEVAAIGADAEAAGEPLRDQRVEEVADVLAVRDAGEGRVLAAEAVAAVQRDGREEPRLPRREPERLDGAATRSSKRHHSRSKWWGSNGRAAAPAAPPRPPPAPAAR